MSILRRFLDYAAEKATPILRDIIRKEMPSLREQLLAPPEEKRIMRQIEVGQFGAYFEPDSVGLIHGLKLAGAFCFRGFNPDGSEAFKPQLLCPNAVTNAALNDVLSVYLNSGTQKTTWYLGLVDNSGWTAFAAADTIASHAGWTESTAYTQSVRQTWTPSAPSGQAITNPTSATFTINTSVTLKGAFLVSDSTKGGTTGTLFATGAFGSTQTLVNGQNLKVTYTCPATAT